MIPAWATLMPVCSTGGRCGMTPDERERMAILCERIAKEQNLTEFMRFVRQLNDLLKHKEQRLRSSP
jgi:hypothetical protein